VDHPKRLGLFRQPWTKSTLPVGEQSISPVNRCIKEENEQMEQSAHKKENAQAEE